MISICAYCKHKGMEQLKDDEGYTFYRWFCKLFNEDIVAYGSCKEWEKADD